MKTLPTLFLLLILIAAPAWAQEDPAPDRPGSPGEAREAIQEYFTQRMRVELALEDDQIDKIVPRIRELERAKAEAKRSRVETVRGLRRGMEGGASDAELKKLLDRLDRIELDQKELERKTLHAIDRELSVRQSVRLRFFMPRFRQEMQKRVRDVRERRSDMPRLRRPPRQRP